MKKRPIKLLTFNLIPLAVAFIIIYLLIIKPVSYHNYENYDLIEHFTEASSVDLVESEEIDISRDNKEGLPAERNLKKLLVLISSNPDISIDNEKPGYLRRTDMYNGLFRIKVEKSKKSSLKIRIRLRSNGKDDCHYLGFSCSDKKNIFLGRSIGGTEKKLFDYYYKDDRKKDTILMLFSRERIVLILNDTIIYNNDMQYGEGNIIEIFPPDISGDFNYSIKFNTLNEVSVEAIFEQIFYNRWGKEEFKPVFPDNKSIPGNVMHILRSGISKRVIALSVGSSIEYKVIIPPESRLEFELSRVDIGRMEKHPPSIDVSIMGEDRVKLAGGSFKCGNVLQWKDFRIDLKNPAKQKVIIRVSAMKKGRNLKSGIFLANPVIRTLKKKDEKSILLISLDTLRADHLGCYGYNRNTSPNIDKLAGESILFKNAITHSPWTLPAHYSIFTSLYPIESGHVLGDFKSSLIYSNLDNNIVTLTEYLKSAGYKTIAVTGNGYVSSKFGFDQGFESYWNIDPKKSKDIKPSVEKTIETIKESRGLKWFVFMHSYEIHDPYTRRYFTSDPSDGEAAATIANYDSGILHADEYLGKLIDYLKKEDLFKSTIIILISDHGESFYNKLTGKPLHKTTGQHGYTMYDTVLKVPFIISGAIDDEWKGKKINDQVRLVDIMPTVLRMIDIESPADIRGISLIPVIRGDSGRELTAYSEATMQDRENEKKSLRTSNWKLVINNYFKTEKNRYRLFNLKDDPEGKIDLSADRIELRDIFRKQILEIIRSQSERIKVLSRNRRFSSRDITDLRENLRALGYLGN